MFLHTNIFSPIGDIIVRIIWNQAVCILVKERLTDQQLTHEGVKQIQCVNYYMRLKLYERKLELDKGWW